MHPGPGEDERRPGTSSYSVQFGAYMEDFWEMLSKANQLHQHRDTARQNLYPQKNIYFFFVYSGKAVVVESQIRIYYLTKRKVSYRARCPQEKIRKTEKRPKLLVLCHVYRPGI